MQRLKNDVTEEVLTEKRVADILGVAVSTVKEYRKRGLLRSYRPVKAVYIFYADLVDFIVSNENINTAIGGITNAKE
ncbi:MAG: helix-turn-helix domain-containing protein [Candidatus Cloacimonetes bacterium]|nr:helix-turn-helix domain-containing protein [Candidatus Cloacimonadota bacterium]